MSPTRLIAMVRAPNSRDSKSVRKFYERQNELLTGMVKTQQAVLDGGSVEKEGSLSFKRTCHTLVDPAVMPVALAALPGPLWEALVLRCGSIA
jgi:hypothetical protein